MLSEPYVCLESLMTNSFFLNMQFYFLLPKALGSVLAFCFPIPIYFVTDAVQLFPLGIVWEHSSGFL